MLDTDRAAATLHEISLCCEALDDKKGEEITVLDVRGKSSVTDFFLVVTGNSQPHIKALRSNLEKTLKDAGVQYLSSEYTEESGWLVLDCFDFIIHLFTPTMRENYGLEHLWKDAEKLDWQNLV